MESLRLSISDQARNLTASEGHGHSTLALGRPISPVDHSAPFCQWHDMAFQTTGPFPSLSARDIELPDNHCPAPDTLTATTDRQIRALMGGKGMFLHVMRQANIPVPPFTVVESSLVATLEQHLFPSEYLLPFLPDGHQLPQTSCSLEELRKMVAEIPGQQQSGWLKGLSAWIASEDFYQQVQGSSTAWEIRDRYLTLRQQFNGACIIRSSGVDEDRFGDAQAGRFDSRVHDGGDILKTCLHVLSSAYQPKACPTGRVKPIALIMQQCILCQLGGVVMSHSSLLDDTIEVEYAPGQPKSAVSGEAGIQPHRYAIRRNSAMGNEPEHHFTPGDIKTQFVLKTTSKEGHIEQSTTVTSDAKDILLADKTLKQLRLYTEQLENIVGCPVDIEFGLDDQQQLYLFQVRPVTRLPGGTRFAAAAPSLPMAEGVMVSEGCCSGPVIAVTEPINAEQFPAGTILFADHASDWMLAPAILQQAGGFVFRQGGTNDHVAITLRQAGIPCLLAGPQYSGALTNALGQQATLVAGSFAGNPGAYLLKGDQSAHWKASSTTSGKKIISSTPIKPTEPPDFTRVDKGFDWLNRQNNKLLDYFHPDRLLSHCLGPGRSKEISMSADRSTLLSQLGREISLLQQDLQQFISGYRRFLNLAITSQQDAEESEVQRLISEFKHLDAQWGRRKDSIDALCMQVVKALATNQELPSRPVNYRQWLMDCQALQDELQKLTQPKKVQDIRSAHDLIYWLHQRFVSALPPVAEASGQGQITEITKDRTLVNVLSEGVFGLLNDDCIQALTQLNALTLRMLNMADAAFINAKLGVHVCTITMLEQAEGGKGRTLCLDISDDFSNEADNRHLQGKLRRFWFLVQTLRCASVDENSRPMDIRFNQSAGKMIIEYTQVNSTQALQAALVKLVTILSGLASLDTSIYKFNCGKNTDKWDFAMLAAKCQKGLEDTMDQWTFKHCLVLDAINRRTMALEWYYDYRFLDYLDRDYKLIFNVAERTESSFKIAKYQHETSELRQIFTDATRDLAPDDATRIIKEILIHFAIEFERNDAFVQLLREYPDLDHDRKLVLFLVRQNPRIFGYIAEIFQDDIEIAKTAIEQRGTSLEYASDRLKNDKPLVLLAVNSDGYALEYASTDLKNDPDVVLSAARNNFNTFYYASPALKNNEALLRKIIEENPSAMRFATESIKDDRDFALLLLSRGAIIYSRLSDRLKSDPEIQRIAENNYAKFTHQTNQYFTLTA